MDAEFWISGLSTAGGENREFSSNLVALTEPSSPAAETYRTLRTNLLYGFIDDAPRTIVLTSPGPGQGKSTTCANLGIVLAQAGKNTLIADCDMRRPAMHKMFGLQTRRDWSTSSAKIWSPTRGGRNRWRTSK